MLKLPDQINLIQLLSIRTIAPGINNVLRKKRRTVERQKIRQRVTGLDHTALTVGKPEIRVGPDAEGRILFQMPVGVTKLSFALLLRGTDLRVHNIEMPLMGIVHMSLSVLPMFERQFEFW